MLRQVSDQLQIATSGPGLTRLSGPINGAIGRSGLQQGLCVALAQHTSCSLTINENADPRVLADLEAYLHDLVPRERRYAHDDEGPDDMPAHLRAALTAVSLSIPVVGGRPVMGTWQGVYLFEHRSAPHWRQVALHVMGA